MKAKTQLILSAISMLMCLIFIIGAVFAWFIFSPKSNDLFLYSGNIDLECEVYVANDRKDVYGVEVFDGMPDIIQFPPSPDLLRSQILASYYTELNTAKDINKAMSEDGDSAFKGMQVGRQILYKIIIKNNSLGKNDALVSLSFENMTGYFSNCVRLYLSGTYDEQQLMEEFQTNSSRLFFNIRSRRAMIYHDLDDTGEYNYPSQDLMGQEELFDEEYLPLWRYSQGESNGEFFIDRIRIDYGTLLELDFALSGDFFTDELNHYIANSEDLYYPKFRWGEEYSELEVRQAIGEIAAKEALFILQDEENGGSALKELRFTIGGIIIKGEQIS